MEEFWIFWFVSTEKNNFVSFEVQESREFCANKTGATGNEYFFHVKDYNGKGFIVYWSRSIKKL